MQFFLTGGGGFTEFEFNLFNSLNTDADPLTLFGLTNRGNAVQPDLRRSTGTGRPISPASPPAGTSSPRSPSTPVSPPPRRSARSVSAASAMSPSRTGTWALMILGFGLIGGALGRATLAGRAPRPAAQTGGRQGMFFALPFCGGLPNGLPEGCCQVVSDQHGPRSWAVSATGKGTPIPSFSPFRRFNSSPR